MSITFFFSLILIKNAIMKNIIKKLTGFKIGASNFDI